MGTGQMIRLDKAIVTLNSTLGTFLRLPLKLIPKGTVVGVRTGLNRGARLIIARVFTDSTDCRMSRCCK